MVIQIDDYTVDVDLDATKAYSQTHCLCDCQDDRNFYVQARERFPKLTQFLSRFGLMIERPDEIGSYAEEGEINYHFVAYTVVGKVLKSGLTTTTGYAIMQASIYDRRLHAYMPSQSLP